MRILIAGLEETRQAPLLSYFHSLLVRAHLVAGEHVQGLEVVMKALAESERTGARYLGSELHRLRGELLVASGADAAEVNRAFGLARKLAQSQGATTLEARVA
jgi:predicted ATPase